jgi:hypothetical protein
MKKWILLLAALPLACSKEANDQSITPAPQITMTSSFDLLQDKLLTPSCASSGCHLSNKDASFPQHGLVLTKGSSYANLVGVASARLHSRIQSCGFGNMHPEKAYFITN